MALQIVHDQDIKLLVESCSEDGEICENTDFDLSEAMQLKICSNDYGVIFVLCKKETGRCLYIYPKFITKCNEVRTDVQKLIDSNTSGTVHTDKKSNQCITVKVFHGKPYIGIHKMDDDNVTIIKGKGMNMNSEEWIVFSSLCKKMDDSVKKIIGRERRFTKHGQLDTVSKSGVEIEMYRLKSNDNQPPLYPWVYNREHVSNNYL